MTQTTTTAHYAESVTPVGVVDSFKFAFSSPTRLRKEVLGGLIVALALIPEAISFSILAGVDPAVGLYASFIMAMVIAFTGGRPAMITAATGAVAVVIAPVAHNHGMDYFLATVILAGIFQIAMATMGVAKLMRFIPRAVMVGFVNALAVIIFMAQIPHLIDVPWIVYPLVALGIAIMVGFPKLTTVVPAPLVAIIVITAIAAFSGAAMPTVRDQGDLPTTLPSLLIPDVPLNMETLQIIAPYAFAMALVGLMESLMAAKLVDDITETHSDKTTEARGQGIANIAAALFGGMGGCAMIGQTMINIKESQARTRLSTFLAGLFLLLLLLLLNDVVGTIPMAALVAVMVMVSVGTMDWHSISPSTLKFMPLSETIVMLVTVIATLATHNLAIGVILGVLTAMIMFARRVAHVVAVDETEIGYKVKGQLFFASSNDLIYHFDYNTERDDVTIDFSEADIWDASTVATLDAVAHKYHAKGKQVHFVGLSEASQSRLDRLTGKLPSH